MPHIELIIQHPSSGVSMPEAPRGKLYQAPPPGPLSSASASGPLYADAWLPLDSNLFEMINIEGVVKVGSKKSTWRPQTSTKVNVVRI